MKTNQTTSATIYDSLSAINRSFHLILQELERLRQIDGFRGRTPIKAAELAIQETRALTMFEILEVLHEREESKWTRFGRQRDRLDRREAVHASHQGRTA